MNRKAHFKLRQERVAGLVDEIKSWEWEYVDRCNVCDSRERTIVATSDRYGFPSRVAICNNCGLGYLVDRLSRNAYARFYDGYYRRLISGWSGMIVNNGSLQGDATNYARELTKLIENEFRVADQLTVLDVGGSTGAVPVELIKRYGLRATVLDPSANELSVAQGLGIETICGQLEDADFGGRQFDLVFVCRTLDHLFDLRASLQRIRKVVSPFGFVFVDYMDIVEHARGDGCVATAARLDHCYYFYHEMAPFLYSQFGLEIVSSYFSIAKRTLGYLLRPSDTHTRRIPTEMLNTVIRRLFEFDGDWRTTPTVRDFTFAERLLDKAKKAGRLFGA